ncbi:hypothetical protein FAI40_05245 [Acetobacteraceae bacterium]|nr:hypothetical protein FAI40_05245 [Acetobacteraceae bacterium]
MADSGNETSQPLSAGDLKAATIWSADTDGEKYLYLTGVTIGFSGSPSGGSGGYEIFLVSCPKTGVSTGTIKPNTGWFPLNSDTNFSWSCLEEWSEGFWISEFAGAYKFLIRDSDGTTCDLNYVMDDDTATYEDSNDGLPVSPPIPPFSFP